jgi:predicted HTH domain antitoxin
MEEFETLEVPIPKELLLGVEKQKFIDDLKLFTAIGLYEQQVLSLGKAAELAGKAKDDFMSVLAEHGIAVLRYPKEELTEELKLLKSTR